ncbi:L-asparagine transporter-like permease [Gracilibacillus halotolerans]|uniref:L-asparagine transporter-like permease n=1 Tax=Gracilibacillus halotolerans TaxID=74386 RepID=A0A841RRK5_9BACI|nr:hypothetical protein [Gracilibacillus halotolerans]MBB6513845.1 L-asparagine transporter-like permease [Gracilibacillus halotolerans]
MKTKEIIGLLVLIGITLYFGGTLLSYFVTDEGFGMTEYLLVIALLVLWTEVLTWRKRGDVRKDEMGKEIIKKSNQISYSVLYLALLFLWMIDYLILNNQDNYIFFIAICLAYLTNPIVQFILVKRQVG